MKRAALLLAMLFLCGISDRARAQETKPCAYVVRQVAFEHPTGLTPQQLAKLRTVLNGTCFDPDVAGEVSERIFNQLRAWGYKRALVYDPPRFRVLDDRAQPAPISIAVDFLLDGTEEFHGLSSR